jgi:hypothetical protein
LTRRSGNASIAIEVPTWYLEERPRRLPSPVSDPDSEESSSSSVSLYTPSDDGFPSPSVPSSLKPDPQALLEGLSRERGSDPCEPLHINY